MPITKASGNSVTAAAKGDLVVGSATNDAAVLGVGTNNQVLTADSSTATGLKWATASSGAYTSLASGNSSTSSSTLVVSSIPSGYNDLVFVAYDFYPSISARTMGITANSVTDYDYAALTLVSGISTSEYGGVGATSIDPQYNSMDNTNDENALRFVIFNYTDTSAYKLVNFTHHYKDRLGNTASSFGWGTINTTSAITSLTINVNANFGAASPYVLYGVK